MNYISQEFSDTFFFQLYHHIKSHNIISKFSLAFSVIKIITKYACWHTLHTFFLVMLENFISDTLTSQELQLNKCKRRCFKNYNFSKNPHSWLHKSSFDVKRFPQYFFFLYSSILNVFNVFLYKKKIPKTIFLSCIFCIFFSLFFF